MTQFNSIRFSNYVCISGYVGHNKFFPNKKKINSCLNLMKKRGPDSQKKKKFFF